jgi:hypothetical protein
VLTLEALAHAGCCCCRSKQPVYADLKKKVRAYFGDEGIKRGACLVTARACRRCDGTT